MTLLRPTPRFPALFGVSMLLTVACGAGCANNGNSAASAVPSVENDDALVARMRQDNASLRKRLLELESRVRRLERDAPAETHAVTVNERHAVTLERRVSAEQARRDAWTATEASATTSPGPRDLPVVKLERETSGDRREGTARMAARGAEPESSTRLRESVTISRGSSHAIDAAGLEPGFGVSATSGAPYGVGSREEARPSAGTVPSDWQVSNSSNDAVLPAHGPGDGGQEEERRAFKLVGSQLVEASKRKRPSRKTSKKPSSKKNKSAPKAHSKKRGRTAKASRDPAAEYQAARSLYTSGKFIEAEQAFERFARANPSHEYADNALYWKGEAAYDQRHFSDALAAFTEVIERYGGGNKASDALLKIGLCYGKIGDNANAKDVLEQLVLAYPNARASSIANKKLAEMSGVQQ